MALGTPEATVLQAKASVLRDALYYDEGEVALAASDLLTTVRVVLKEQGIELLPGGEGQKRLDGFRTLFAVKED